MHARSPAVLACLALCASACVGGLDTGPRGPDGVGPRTPPTTPTIVHLPSSVRRLGRVEHDNAVSALLGGAAPASDGFAGDARLAGYTTGADLRVDAVLGDQLRISAEALAADAITTRRAALVPCDTSAADCPRTFVTTIATRAFRRPATAEEIDALLVVFRIASDGGTFDDGATAVLTAILQSASFLYVPQIGAGRGERVLDAYETASAISFLLTAAPPDDALLEAAADDALSTPAAREAHARRILAEDPRARAQVARFVREWLAIDTLDHTTRTGESGDFAALRPLFVEETERFVGAVVFEGEGTLEQLLTADFTIANGALADFYGLPDGGERGWARRELGGTARRGLLSSGAFLSAHARTDSSSPVKRGVTVLSRLLCRTIPFPTGETAARAMAEPPMARTTRERFAQHSTDGVCAGCHALIDPIGFGLEHFDQLGAYRAEENGVAVDASGVLTGTDVDGPFDGAPELAARLAQSDEARVCFARNVWRFASGSVERGPEESFVARWRAMPEERRTSVIEVLVELITSDALVGRRETP